MLKKEFQKEEYNEARQNLSGFFELLLKIDKRVNPGLYKVSNEELNNEKYEDNRSTNNANQS